MLEELVHIIKSAIDGGSSFRFSGNCRAKFAKIFDR